MRSKLTWVDDNLAFGSIPDDKYELEYVAKNFDLIVAVCSSEELHYDVDLLYDVNINVKFIHLDTPDFGIPLFSHMYLTIEKIIDTTRDGGRVFIHCVGGRGRSGTIAAAYLMRRYGYTARDAIRQVRELRSGAIETRLQELLLETYEHVLKTFSLQEIEAVHQLGEKYCWADLGDHLTITAVHAARIFSQLRESLSLNWTDFKPLFIGSYLHDIGRATGTEYDHHRHSYRIIREELDYRVCAYIREVAALVALHHRRRTDPRKDPKCRDYLDLVLKLASIVRIADLTSKITEDVVVRVEGSKILLMLLSSPYLDYYAEDLLEKAQLLSDIMGKEIDVVQIEDNNLMKLS